MQCLAATCCVLLSAVTRHPRRKNRIPLSIRTATMPQYQVETLSCEPDIISGTDLAAGATASCTVSYLITQANIDANKVRGKAALLLLFVRVFVRAHDMTSHAMLTFSFPYKSRSAARALLRVQSTWHKKIAALTQNEERPNAKRNTSTCMSRINTTLCLVLGG